MEDVLKKLNDFVIRHKVILQERGTCGFSRPCVGFVRNGNYININPYDEDYMDHLKEFYCGDFYAPKGVENYHKHDCLAVLCEDTKEGYEEGLRQLLEWIEYIENKHEIIIIDRENHPKNVVEVVFKGITTPTMKLKKEN